MRDLPIQNSLPESKEKVRLQGTFRGKYRVFAVFLISCAILLAGFAMTAAVRGAKGLGLWEGLGSFMGRDTEQTTPAPTPAPDPKPDGEEPKTPIPEGATPIASKDLSALSLGGFYIHNETPYRPDVAGLLRRGHTPHAKTDAPLVLILHTHTSEGYLPEGTAYLTEPIGDATYTDDRSRSVIAAGEELARALNENGICTLHCTVIHDTPTLGGSYDRSAETVKRYLEEYPTIEYVIDLHRDAVVDGDGALVRAVTEENGERVAQVMAVVGTDANGTNHPRWEENLTLALGLRELLNADSARICRPVSLRNASFHQELSRYSLLLEIGSSANSPEEAKRAAQRVGDALVKLILGE